MLQPSVADLRPPPLVAVPPLQPDRQPAAAGEESQEAAVQAARDRVTVRRPAVAHLASCTWAAACVAATALQLAQQTFVCEHLPYEAFKACADRNCLLNFLVCLQAAWF